MYFCFIGIDSASLYDFAIGFLNCSGNGMFLINILFCHLSCFYFAVLSFFMFLLCCSVIFMFLVCCPVLFMFLLCCPVIFHVSTLLPCHFSCFYFAALSFVMFLLCRPVIFMFLLCCPVLSSFMIYYRVCN